MRGNSSTNVWQKKKRISFSSAQTKRLALMCRLLGSFISSSVSIIATSARSARPSRRQTPASAKRLLSLFYIFCSVHYSWTTGVVITDSGAGIPPRLLGTVRIRPFVTAPNCYGPRFIVMAKTIVRHLTFLYPGQCLVCTPHSLLKQTRHARTLSQTCTCTLKGM